MKRRWTVLFYATLASLVGISWLAKSLGISLGSFMGFSLLGMIAACVMAGVALMKNIPEKWPAAVVLACAAPMVMDTVGSIDNLTFILRYFGASFGLMVAGALATAAASIYILAAPLPRPPPGPQVAPARVVD